MNRPAAIASVALIVLTLASVAVMAAGGGPVIDGGSYIVARSTIDSGGGTSSGGTYAVSGTIAQADADPLQPSSGGAYKVTGGFWPGWSPDANNDVLFAHGFE